MSAEAGTFWVSIARDSKEERKEQMLGKLAQLAECYTLLSNEVEKDAGNYSQIPKAAIERCRQNVRAAAKHAAALRGTLI